MLTPMMDVEYDGSTAQRPGFRRTHDAHRAHPSRAPASGKTTAPPLHRPTPQPCLDLDSAARCCSARAVITSGRNEPPPAGSATGKAGGQRGQGANAAAPVDAAKAVKGNIGVYVTGLGAVTPIYTVTVQTRVDGELMQVLYKEGDMVHKGDKLAEIDPRPYQAQLTQYEGQLIRDQALLDNARIDQARYETLLKQNAVPEQQLATQIALVKQDEGT